jgi:hypothetical protein
MRPTFLSTTASPCTRKRRSWAALEMPNSGLRSSWATPAATSPMASRRRFCSTRRTSQARSMAAAVWAASVLRHARGLVEALGEVGVVDVHGHGAEHALGARHGRGELEAVVGVAQGDALVGEGVEPGGEEALLDGGRAPRRSASRAPALGHVAELVGGAEGGGVLVGDGEAEAGAAHGAAHLLGDLAVDAVEVEGAREGEPGLDERLARAVARRDVDRGAGEAREGGVGAVGAQRRELHEEDALLVGGVARELPADDGELAAAEDGHGALELLARVGSSPSTSHTEVPRTPAASARAGAPLSAAKRAHDWFMLVRRPSRSTVHTVMGSASSTAWAPTAGASAAGAGVGAGAAASGGTYAGARGGGGGRTCVELTAGARGATRPGRDTRRHPGGRRAGGAGAAAAADAPRRRAWEAVTPSRARRRGAWRTAVWWCWRCWRCRAAGGGPAPGG